jgi:aldehyde dehydrogenase (NAD+)
METTVAQPKIGNSVLSVPMSPNTSTQEILRIYKTQQANRQNVKDTTAKQRKAKLKKLESAVLHWRKKIQDAIYADFKKPKPETDLTEMSPALIEIRHAITDLTEWMRPKVVDTPFSFFGTSSKLIYEPKGVTLIIAPWNYPFQLCIIPLVGAIAAGNTAILKPSEFTPHTGKIVKEMLKTVFDENEVAVVEGDYTVSAELLKLKFDHIFFTGSPAVGKIVMKAAAEYLTSVTLELGGKSPAIIDETANIKIAAKRTAWGKCINAGQTCIAPDYALVHSSKYDSFIDEFKNTVTNFYGENDTAQQESDSYTRIVNSKHHGRIKRLIDDAVEKGAKITLGGSINEEDNFIAPTILTNVPADAKIMEEEIFGPVLPVVKYNSIEEAFKIINEKEKPLALYIFSSSNRNIDNILQNTTAGGTAINDTLIHNSHPNLPFGGVNNSGIGSSHGYFSFKAFSHERAVLKQWNPKASIENMYPPYTGFKKKMIEFVMNYFS